MLIIILISYRPGSENGPADTLSRAYSASLTTSDSLDYIHSALCHPGVTRLYHFVRSKNLPYSLDDVKKVIQKCDVCARLKPKFYDHTGTLIKATQPFERLSIDFKGPLPSTNENRYLLTVVDEYSRFPFAFPCRDVSANSVINCLTHLFSIFGMPSFIHSDCGSSFLSHAVKTFFNERGIATSRTTPYNPTGNGQVERYNGIIWNAIKLALTSKNLPIKLWECVLPDALHSIRSLLCTSTNSTPHERMFNFTRKSSFGKSIPTWLTSQGKVLLKNFNRQSKYDPLIEEVELVEANPEYAFVRFGNGKETSVSLKHLAPLGDNLCTKKCIIPPSNSDLSEMNVVEHAVPDDESASASNTNSEFENSNQNVDPAALTTDMLTNNDSNYSCPTSEVVRDNIRRSNRIRKEPSHLQDFVRK